MSKPPSVKAETLGILAEIYNYYLNPSLVDTRVETGKEPYVQEKQFIALVKYIAIQAKDDILQKIKTMLDRRFLNPIKDKTSTVFDLFLSRTALDDFNEIIEEFAALMVPQNKGTVSEFLRTKCTRLDGDLLNGSVDMILGEWKKLIPQTETILKMYNVLFLYIEMILKGVKGRDFYYKALFRFLSAVLDQTKGDTTTDREAFINGKIQILSNLFKTYTEDDNVHLEKILKGLFEQEQNTTVTTKYHADHGLENLIDQIFNKADIKTWLDGAKTESISFRDISDELDKTEPKFTKTYTIFDNPSVPIKPVETFVGKNGKSVSFKEEQETTPSVESTTTTTTLGGAASTSISTIGAALFKYLPLLVPIFFTFSSIINMDAKAFIYLSGLLISLFFTRLFFSLDLHSDVDDDKNRWLPKGWNPFWAAPSTSAASLSDQCLNISIGGEVQNSNYSVALVIYTFTLVYLLSFMVPAKTVTANAGLITFFVGVIFAETVNIFRNRCHCGETGSPWKPAFYSAAFGCTFGAIYGYIIGKMGDAKSNPFSYGTGSSLSAEKCSVPSGQSSYKCRSFINGREVKLSV